MSRKIVIVCVVLLALLAGCVTREVKVGAADNGREITLKQGQTLAVALEANPTTGYNWLLVSEPDSAVLSVVGDEFEAPSRDRVGAGGVTTWRFRALATGETSFQLGYARSWEEGVEPLETFSLRVVVR